MDDLEARQLALRLQTIPPEACLDITWNSHETQTTKTTTGTVTDHEPDTGYRRLETDNRTLELVPAGDNTNVTVQEPTPTTTHTRGELTDIDIQTVPLLEAPLTEDGFEVPDPLIGLTGYVTVDLPTRNHVINLANHGLEETDYRLLGNISTDPDPDFLPEEPAVIRPDTGPHYHVAIVDERTNPGPPEYEPAADDQDLQRIRNTVRSLKRATNMPNTLPEDTRRKTHVQFVRIDVALQTAHRNLCTTGTPPKPDPDPVDNPAYTEAAADLERELENCLQTLKNTLSPTQWQPVEESLREARLELRTLRQLLVGVDQQESATPNNDCPEIVQWIIEPGAPAPVERGDDDD